MELQALVLTPWMAVHQTVSWQDAICLVYQDKAAVLEEYEATVSSPSVTLRVPAVVRLKRTIARVKTAPKFSRVSIYTRDGYRCQYCGLKKTVKQLNYDHVVPRSQGGLTVWENIVTSCIKCNLHKDCRTPDQAGMRLLKRPIRPKSLPMTGTFLVPASPPELWVPYLDKQLEAEAG